jgi:hypothetical protein
MDKFNRMRLKYLGTSEPRHTGNRVFRGYWKIPGENYEFRIIAVMPRNTWAIEVRPTTNDSKYLLKAELGIEFIQRIICDKFELLPHNMPITRWQEREERLYAYMYKRSTFLLLNNLNKDNNGKKITITTV